jgi:hypothetical protein
LRACRCLRAAVALLALAERKEAPGHSEPAKGEGECCVRAESGAAELIALGHHECAVVCKDTHERRKSVLWEQGQRSLLEMLAEAKDV